MNINNKMTAKEKAEELIVRFDHTTYGLAINGALICVEELIKELILLQINESHDARVVNRVNFLNNVKEELLKL